MGEKKGQNRRGDPSGNRHDLADEVHKEEEETPAAKPEVASAPAAEPVLAPAPAE